MWRQARLSVFDDDTAHLTRGWRVSNASRVYEWLALIPFGKKQQHTIGLGCVLPRAVAANSKARRMYARS